MGAAHKQQSHSFYTNKHKRTMEQDEPGRVGQIYNYISITVKSLILAQDER